jgi:predicted O-linked N-acetylglucosamine transferase (SPINDLY family)
MTEEKMAAQADAALQQGMALHRQYRLDEAGVLYEQVLQSYPGNFRAVYLLGIVALQKNDPARADGLLARAAAIDPQSASAHNDYGRAQNLLGRLEQALAAFERAIAINPDHSAAHINRSDALNDLKQFEAAVAGYDRALALKPDSAAAHNSRGNALFALRRYEDAAAAYERAIALRPDYSDAHNNRGNALHVLGRHDAALESFNKAISLDPGYADWYASRGTMLGDLKQYRAAVADLDTAISLRSEVRSLSALRLFAKMHICDWSGRDADIALLTEGIDRDEPVVNPFILLALSDSAALQQRAAQVWARRLYREDPGLPATLPRGNRGKIRIGYFSADFHDHATMHLMAGVFEAHDRSKFETFALSFGPDSQDEVRKRLVASCDQFIDVRGKSDRDVALLARGLGLDIAVDLKGYTKDGRPGIFASRAAPVQVSYLGYPGTLGAPYMDYLIADRTLIPEGSRRFYTEKIIELPHSYQANDSTRAIADRVFTREEFGLPQSGFVFCCMNNTYKITPTVFDWWMRILKRVEGSVLWLFEDNPSAANYLREEAVRRDVQPERLIFAKRMSKADHVARHRAADLFIDTWPCNAHTTASDSLWAGLPVLTCSGEAFAGRVAASLLMAVGLPELIAATPADYEEMAVALAADAERLADIKQRLIAARDRAPLFDTQLTTRHLEAAYAQIFTRHQDGLAAEHLAVPPDDLK